MIYSIFITIWLFVGLYSYYIILDQHKRREAFLVFIFFIVIAPALIIVKFLYDNGKKLFKS